MTDEEYDKLTDEERLKIRQSLFDYFATLTMEEQFEEEESNLETESE